MLAIFPPLLLTTQKAAKYDPEVAKKVFEWIVSITGEEGIRPADFNQPAVHEALKDGVTLCKYE